MGLNDNFFTLPTQDESEAENKAVAVKAFAPTAPGNTPELLDNVEFIAVPQEEVAEDAAALETICVALRDIQIFGQTLRDQGGISMGMALESLDYLPGLVTEKNPKEFYTTHVSRTMLNHALEQEEVETKNLVGRAVETMRKFFGRIVAWFKAKIAQFTGKDKIEAGAKREKDLQEKLKASEEKANKMAEEYDQLRRASAGDVASYKEQLGIATKQVSDANARAATAEADARNANQRAAAADADAQDANAKAELSAADAAQSRNAATQATSAANAKVAEAAAQVGAANAKVGELTVQLRDLQTQMRNLDETKSQEIAVALDKLEALQRKAATSRAARLEVTAQAEELRAIVSKVITKTIAETMEKHSNTLLEAYSQSSRMRIIGQPLVARYMLGSGLPKRVQMIQKTGEYLSKASVLADHMKALNSALKVVSTDPAKLMQAMQSFDGSNIGQLDIVFENNKPGIEGLNGVPAQRLTGFLREMQAAAEKGREVAEKADFSAIFKEMEEISKQLESDQSLKVDYKFVNPVVEAYRALQKHVGKLLPIVSNAARISHELLELGSNIIASLPSRLAFVNSKEFETFCQGVMNEVCAQVGVSTNYLTAADMEVKGHAITILTRAGQA